MKALLDRTGLDDQAARMERLISCRTWGRVQGVRVEMREGKVVIFGRAPTYYVRQLALAAVAEVLGKNQQQLEIEVSVEVCSP
jgi:hypothetical protein